MPRTQFTTDELLKAAKELPNVPPITSHIPPGDEPFGSPEVSS